MKILRPYFYPVLGIGILAFIYFLTFPTTVQSGDTGELVANSLFLRVLHPPGYPLFNLLYHFFLKNLEILSAFGTASVLTIFISLTWVTILLIRYRSLEGLLIVLVTGTSMLFWRYSVLPDVFALHLLVLTFVLLAFDQPTLLSRPWFIFLISFGVAHHHTIVFAFPLFLYACYQGNLKKILTWSVLAGVSSFSLYFLQMKFDPLDLYSWGFLTTPGSVISHFLREEYGTFRLSIWDESSFDWMIYFVELVLKDYWSFLLAGGFLSYRMKLDWRRKEWILVSCVAIYFLVFGIAGAISLNLAGQGVFERFLLQPFLFLIFLLLMCSRNVSFPHWLKVCLVINVALNIGIHFRENNYSNNKVIEDYTINILKSLPDNSIYYPHGDTEAFAAYYVKEVLHIRPDVVIFPAVGIVSWAKEKISQSYPDILEDRGPEILEKINLKKFKLFTNKQIKLIPNDVKVTHFGMVDKYEAGDDSGIREAYQCEVASEYQWRTPPTLQDFEKFDYSYILALKNSICYLGQGVDALKNKQLQEALSFFEKGQALSPYSVRILDGKCRTLGLLGDERKNSCDKELEHLIENESQQYFLYKF